jgi:exopolyphosphatase/guanosine-5'-triphosphate,3'-diphosphate pyrophosphatase
MNSELTGFSEAERAVIANIARYHRGPLPKERHKEYAVLNAADRDSVHKLGGIVRIADALDRSHDSRVSNLRCRYEPGSIRIDIVGNSDCESELIEVQRKKDLFEKAFNRNLLITDNAKKAKSA